MEFLRAPVGIGSLAHSAPSRKHYFRWTVAGAVQRASWSSCGARWRCWAAAAFRVAGAVHRGCLSRGRRSTRSLLVERGRRWAAAAFRLAGAVHRASWSSCGARGHCWAAAAFRVAGAVHRASCRAAARLGAAPLLITIHFSSASHTPLITSQLYFLHLISHTLINSSQLHFWHLTFHTSLITSHLTPHLSHHNSLQLHFSHLTSHTLTHHSSTPRTSLLTS